MNGYECGGCGHSPCICLTKKEKHTRECKDEIAVIERVYEILLQPKGFRKWIIGLMWPDIVKVADILREGFYWK